jgi:hypothetical protein
VKNDYRSLGVEKYPTNNKKEESLNGYILPRD